MERSNQTQRSLRARIAHLEQRLRDTGSSNQKTEMSPHATSHDITQKRDRSTVDQVASKKAKYIQQPTKIWNNYQSTLGSKKIEALSRSLGKNFKWVAPIEPVIEMPALAAPLSRRVSTILRIPTPGLVTDQLALRSSTIAGITTDCPSSSNKFSRSDQLLAKIKSINMVVTSRYNVINNDNSGTTNRMNTSWTCSDATKGVPDVAKMTKKVRNAIKNTNKWTNKSVAQNTGNINKNVTTDLREANSTQMINTMTRKHPNALRKHGNKQTSIPDRKSWTKQDEDFTFVPIITDQSCLFFNKFGKCRMGSKCVFEHDPSRVAICRLHLQNRCVDINCLLSHSLQPEKMPDCEYFEKGICFKDNCIYRHVKFNDDAKVCDDFLKGNCPLGIICRCRHVILGGGLTARKGLKIKSKKEIGITKKNLKFENDKNAIFSVENRKQNESIIEPTNLCDDSETLSSSYISMQPTDKIIHTDLVETDLFIPFTRTVASSSTAMRSGDHRNSKTPLINTDVKETEERADIDGGEEDSEGEERENTEEIDDEEGESYEDSEIHQESHSPNEGEQILCEKGREERTADTGIEDDDDESAEDDNCRQEKEAENIQRSLTIDILTAANILQYIPKCLY